MDVKQNPQGAASDTDVMSAEDDAIFNALLSTLQEDASTKVNHTEKKSEVVPTTQCTVCGQWYSGPLDNHIASASHASEIIPGLLYLGGFWNAQNMYELSFNRIQCILNCAYELKRPDFAMSHFGSSGYRKLNWDDSPEQLVLMDLPNALDFIYNSLVNDKPVLVHCAQGISRSATVIIAYLIKTRNFSVQEALQFVRAKRPGVNPNIGFQTELNLFARLLEPLKCSVTHCPKLATLDSQ